MAYSTRRKSVNLALLGIHVPSSRPSQQRSPATTTTSSTTTDHTTPPSKKLKRSHSDAIPRRLSQTSPYFALPGSSREVRQPVVTHTPPPSPPPLCIDASHPRVDTEGINDEVVVATIDLLETTNNRPHMLKELATAISGHVSVVETSANQSAIISSRLTNFMKRPWTALAPCPLGKDLIGTHPKRLFFYLSGRPHLPFPEPERTVSHRIISPSLTSATDEDEDQTRHRRAELSPSPEVELIVPDLNDVTSPVTRSNPFPTAHLSSTGDTATTFAQSRASPPLELDEREFTRTATSLQQLRRMSELQDVSMELSVDIKMEDAVTGGAMAMDNVSEEYLSQRDKEAADTVFGQSDSLFPMRRAGFLMSSPMMPAQQDPEPTALSGRPAVPPLVLSSMADKMDTSFGWPELKSPETVELAELEDLFESY